MEYLDASGCDGSGGSGKGQSQDGVVRSAVVPEETAVEGHKLGLLIGKYGGVYGFVWITSSDWKKGFLLHPVPEAFFLKI